MINGLLLAITNCWHASISHLTPTFTSEPFRFLAALPQHAAADWDLVLMAYQCGPRSQFSEYCWHLPT